MQERVPPEDQLLARAIATSDPGHLAPLAGVLPADFLNSLRGLLAAPNVPLAPLATQFAIMGLKQTALACLDRALAAGPPLAERADILERRGALLGTAQQTDKMVARLRGQSATPPLAEHQSDGLRTVCAAASPGEHSRLRDAVPDHPLRRDPLRDPWHSKSRRLARQDPVMGAAEDFSFLVAEGQQPRLHVECGVEGDGPLACLQSAIRLTALPGVSSQAYALALQRLEALARHVQAPFILMESDGSEPEVVIQWLARHGRARRMLDYGWIALDQSVEAIEKAFRDTHRQQVRWGRRHLDIGSWRTEDDAPLVDAFFGLCAQENRVVAVTPDDLRQSLAKGDSLLYVASLDNRPVSAVIVSRHGDDCYYEAGVSQRQGNKPLSHAPLAQAIVDAHAKGWKAFHLGVLHTDPAFDPKLRSIAGFKRGFTKTFRPVTWVAVHPPE